ncbi:hypothetical protein ONS96_011652 [Cadophora gregata f. sp. sojae]|nr:hypothetical protein ONS96_011652 [Cadophora gregata f. sp. sojae]
MTEPKLASTGLEPRSSSPLLDDADIGDGHDTQTSIDDPIIVDYEVRRTGQLLEQVRERLEQPIRTSTSTELESYTSLLQDADVDENHEDADSSASPLMPIMEENAPVPARVPAQERRQVQDEMSILGVPRETIEEMMREWSKILIQGLRKENTREQGGSEDVELGEMLRAIDSELLQEELAQPVELGEGSWDGGLVEVMSEEQIEAEDTRRALELKTDIERMIRGLGPLTTTYAPFEPPADCWSIYWVGNDEAIANEPRECTPQTWQGTAAEMQAARLELWTLRETPIQGVLIPYKSCACRLRLIGKRLHEVTIDLLRGLPFSSWHTAEDKIALASYNGAMLLKIIVEYLWLVRRKREKATINETLRICWQRGIIHAEKDIGNDGKPSWNNVRLSVYLVLLSLHCVDVWDYLGEIGPASWRPSINRDLRQNVEHLVGSGNSLDGQELLMGTAKYLSRSLYKFNFCSDVCLQWLWSDGDQGIPMCSEEKSGKVFQREDFRVDILQVVGRLQVLWTTQVDEHLVIFEGRTGHPVLKLFWFHFNTSWSR